MKWHPVPWAKAAHPSLVMLRQQRPVPVWCHPATCLPTHRTLQLPCYLSHAHLGLSPRLSSLSSTSSSLPGSSWPGARSVGSDAMATCGVWSEPGQGRGKHLGLVQHAGRLWAAIMHNGAPKRCTHARLMHARLTTAARTSTSSSLGRSSGPNSTTSGGLAAAGWSPSWGGSWEGGRPAVQDAWKRCNTQLGSRTQ